VVHRRHRRAPVHLPRPTSGATGRSSAAGVALHAVRWPHRSSRRPAPTAPSLLPFAQLLAEPRPPLLHSQLRKRIFWTAYTLDRMMAMSLGRPTGISDRDIDIGLPFNVDCVDLNPTAPLDDSITTSSTSSNRLIELKRIESRIQKHAYRVDRPTIEPPDELLQAIAEWETRIPAEAAVSLVESFRYRRGADPQVSLTARDVPSSSSRLARSLPPSRRGSSDVPATTPYRQPRRGSKTCCTTGAV
jgi:hypothetical protein